MAQAERSQRDEEAFDEPYIPASSSLPEITAKAIVLAVLLTVVLAGANAYLGLKVGLTVSASIPAAVISMAVLRFFKESNILENNIIQTAASAGEALAAGVIFTIPALVILRYWQNFQWLPVAAIAITGGILGVMFTIPLRRALILQTRLKFPEGVATGEVLKAGSEGGQGARSIAIAGAAGALFKLLQTGFGVAASTVSGAVAAGGAIFAVGSGLGVALLGVGYIVGINIAVLVFMGGAISWFLGIPIYTALAGSGQIESITQGAEGYDAALAIWSSQIRYLGVGAMAVGGVWALLSLAGPVRDGVRSSVEAMRRARSGGESGLARTEQDTPINFVLFGALAMMLPIFVVFLFVLDRDALGITGGLYLGTIVFGIIFAFIAGFLFSSVAAYMAGLVGSSNNPVSGVTIATILAVSLILLVLLGLQVDFGVDAGRATAAAATAIMVGGVVCCAAAIGGDNMQDLKAGNIVGATPFKQQIMQVIGVVVAALAIAPILSVLFQAYGLGGVFPREGMDPSEALAAPQATLMASVSEGVFAGGLPWGMFCIGCAIAAAIIAADRVLEARGAGFRMPVLAVAVGLYLPIELSVPILAGGLVALFASRSLSRRRAELGDDFDEVNVRASRRGLLFASGLITGEALMGILLAIPFAIAQTTDVFTVAPSALGLSEGAFGVLINAIGVAAFASFALWLYRVASSERR